MPDWGTFHFINLLEHIRPAFFPNGIIQPINYAKFAKKFRNYELRTF